MSTESVNIMEPVAPSRSISAPLVARSNSSSSEDEFKKQYVYIPDFKLALPDKLAQDVLKLKAPLDLVLTIPVKTFPSALDSSRNYMELKPHELQIHWQLRTVFEARGEDTPDTTMSSQNGDSPPQSQSML